MNKLILLVFLVLQAAASSAQRSSNAKELFIEILEPGKYTVYVNDEMIGSAKGRFRFYDVAATAPTITILQNNRQVIKTSLNLQSDSRTIASYNKRDGLRVAKTLPMFANRQYVLGNWDQSSAQAERPTNDDRPTRPVARQVMSDALFKEFFASVKRESFDDTKEKMIKTSLRGNWITTTQLVALLNNMTFDSNKLSVAKAGYDFVIDKQNFFKIYPQLQFSTSKDELMDYVNKRS